MFIRVHINSYIKVSLFRVKTIKAPMSHFWNVDFDLPNTFIKKLSFRVVATFNFFRNSVIFISNLCQASLTTGAKEKDKIV